MNLLTTESSSRLLAMLFADVEGSTGLAASLGDEWSALLEAYREILESTVRSMGGVVESTAGDGVFVTFDDLSAAGRAAVAIQRELRSYPWPAAVSELKVRMGLHFGPARRLSYGLVGLEIHRAARVGAAAHGGQILMTGVAAELLRDVVPSQAIGAHRLKDFPAPVALFCAVVDGQGAGSFPPPRTLELREGNLPAAPAGLIGRHHDLDRVRAALQEGAERWVTVLGRGGVGKTSLALTAANELVGDYDGGVWWIDASQERDRDGLRSLIARTCRVKAEHAWIAELGSRGRLLLVLDNLEGIADAAALLDPLLERSPYVSLLVTSQRPTRSRFERRVGLECLEESDALALLARSAERIDVPLEADAACTELVRLLDCLPLAIELAVGRLRLFRPAELVARLSGSMAILQDRERPDRHRSLSAALDWTLGLLDPDARELFARLGVFAGPVELEDIEVVAGGDGLDVVSALATLLDVSLLQRVETGDGRVRFAYPEAIRQQATRLLSAQDAEVWQRAHAVWQRDLVWPARIHEFVESRVVERAHAAAADTRAALDWAAEHDRRLWREIALGRYALASRANVFGEARALIDSLLADPGDDPEVVDLVREHALLRYAPGGEHAERQVCLYDELSDLHARYLCALNASIALTWELRFADAISWSERAAALGREISPLAEADVLVVRADTLLEAGRDDDAEAALAAADAIAGALRPSNHDRSELVRALLASNRGAHAEAFDRYGRALTHAELVGDEGSLQIASVNLVRALARAGREAEMLEVAGIVEAIADESAADGIELPQVLAERQPPVTEALARLGPPAEAVFAAGKALEPRARTKRICALIYTDVDARHEVNLQRPLVAAGAATSSATALETTVGELTAREAEVLRLLAQGLTDGQIADELVVSRRTVHAHLRAIYRKLDVGSRSAATRWALEHGLS